MLILKNSRCLVGSAIRSAIISVAFLATVWPEVTAADTSQPVQTGALSIELSSAQTDGASCLLSFVTQNTYAQDVAQAVFETVLFDASGQVSQLTLLDFQDLPAGRTRVRQFQFPMACTDISRVLINGAETCHGTDLPENACTHDLTLTSKVMELAG
ncbi:hypothetical protein [Phaeobacter sp. C3_T13_0]|uniref:hypothetical protein n=1 Tax=Phaeobacter cretensis TaxID=3342641 RepID=UPI0039BC9FB0